MTYHQLAQSRATSPTIFLSFPYDTNRKGFDTNVKISRKKFVRLYTTLFFVSFQVGKCLGIPNGSLYHFSSGSQVQR